jgi:5-methylcytosine-specific restriction endonuclease McrA
VAVFVIDKRKKPLMPCSEKRARKLLDSGRARVHRLIPFAIRLIDREVADCVLQPVTIKIDPGSKFTGIALVRESETIDRVSGEIQKSITVLNLFELAHRGRQISEALTARRQMRRRRRSNLRYRAPRFLNRGNKAQGWLAPSLQHRVDTTMAWVSRLRRLAPVSFLAQELVRFDMQIMDCPDISGVQYQQGTLAGYEVREYLLEKFGRKCVYCGAENTPLNIDHVHPKAKGGSSRISNLTLACIPCNSRKAARQVELFLAEKPDVLKQVLAQVKRPLKDAAAVNSTRWSLFNALKATGLPVTTGSGGHTKFNRHLFSIPKTHALDAACVGDVSAITGWQKPTLALKCTGRGSYQRTRLDSFGFPRGYLMREKSIKGFRTGDRVVATVPAGKKAGIHTGRVAIRKTGSFNIQVGSQVIQGIGYKYCRILQRGDGYGYAWLPTTEKDKQLPGFLPQPDRAASPIGLLRKPDDQGWGIHRSFR